MFTKWKKKLTYKVRRLVSRLGGGTLPDFIIIGAQRCGTTSLYNYLVQHPLILECMRKEVHYFDIRFVDRKIHWYKGFFPIKVKKPYVIGEASPYYLVYPHTAKRVFGVLPKVKLIVMLRNPVDRAYSNYRFVFRKNQEHLSFEEALEKEPERLEGEEEKLLQDESYYSHHHKKHAYMARGIYYSQIERWLSVFPKEQLLFIISEEFFANPKETLERVLKHLEFDDCHWPTDDFEKFNSTEASEDQMNPETRKFLIDHFRPHNQKLAELLGRELPWNK